MHVHESSCVSTAQVSNIETIRFSCERCFENDVIHDVLGIYVVQQMMSASERLGLPSLSALALLKCLSGLIYASTKKTMTLIKPL